MWSKKLILEYCLAANTWDTHFGLSQSWNFCLKSIKIVTNKQTKITKTTLTFILQIKFRFSLFQMTCWHWLIEGEAYRQTVSLYFTVKMQKFCHLFLDLVHSKNCDLQCCKICYFQFITSKRNCKCFRLSMTNTFYNGINCRQMKRQQTLFVTVKMQNRYHLFFDLIFPTSKNSSWSALSKVLINCSRIFSRFARRPWWLGDEALFLELTNQKLWPQHHQAITLYNCEKTFLYL